MKEQREGPLDPVRDVICPQQIGCYLHLTPGEPDHPLRSAEVNPPLLTIGAGSGETGVAALVLDRRFFLVDSDEEVLVAIARRFDGVDGITWVGSDPSPSPTPGRKGSAVRPEPGSPCR